MRPSIGRVLHVVGAPATSNGVDIAPAIVTRVWSDMLINCTVLPDGGAPVPATSVPLVASEDEARRINAGKDFPQTLAFWPSRVE